MFPIRAFLVAVLPRFFNSECCRSHSTAGLLRLPLELLAEIIQSCEEFYDALALVMTSKMLYAVGFTIIQRRITEIAGPSAGNRVICLGEYNEWPLPTGKWGQPESTSAYDKYGNRYIPSAFCAILAWPGTQEYQTNGISPSSDALKRIMQVREPDVQALILCNLSKREYIDGAKAIEMLTLDDLANDIDDLLGAILRCRICWSSHVSSGLSSRYNVNLNQCAWAGDHFEATTKDRLASIEPLKGCVHEEWKDVTEEVLKETEKIFRTYWGF